MGYESRIMIVNAHREHDEKSENFGKVYYAEIVANIRLGCMGYNNGWRELFAKEIDFELYVDSDNETTIKALMMIGEYLIRQDKMMMFLLR